MLVGAEWEGKARILSGGFVVVSERNGGDRREIESGGGKRLLQKSNLIGGVLSSFQNKSGERVVVEKGRKKLGYNLVWDLFGKEKTATGSCLRGQNQRRLFYILSHASFLSVT